MIQFLLVGQAALRCQILSDFNRNWLVNDSFILKEMCDDLNLITAD